MKTRNISNTIKAITTMALLAFTLGTSTAALAASKKTADGLKNLGKKSMVSGGYKKSNNSSLKKRPR